MNTPESSKLQPRVAILGATGMIGSAIYDALKDSCSLIVTYRSSQKLELLYQQYGHSLDCRSVQFDFLSLAEDYRLGSAGQTAGPNLRQLLSQIGQVDWVINAMGVTKMIANVNPEATMFLNGSVPHILAAHFGDRFIHITTDCVFDGAQGAPYDESSPKRPVDLYGLSKMIGEPASTLVIRCSTIGPELSTKYGLWEWFLSQPHSVNGFTNHRWNGITTRELGRVCLKLVTRAVAHPGAGTYHIFSEDITKEQLLRLFQQVTSHAVEIVPVTAPVAIDRRLATQRPLNQKLTPPSIEAMVKELIRVGLVTK